MFSFLQNRNTTQVISTAASLAASAILVLGIYRFRRYFSFSNINFSHQFSSPQTIFIEEKGYWDDPDQKFQAVDTYLGTKAASSLIRLRVKKYDGMSKLVSTLDMNEEVIDVFQNVQVRWRLIFNPVETSNGRQDRFARDYQLTFDEKHEEMMLSSYLPFVFEQSNAIKQQSKEIKLNPVDRGGVDYHDFHFDHPVTFKNLAMDSELKGEILDDLNSFKNGKEYYTSIGKPWQRSYMIYGSPGTSKSSLVAAMANQLNYDIYDIDLLDFEEVPELLESSVADILGRSILVVEDIGCMMKLLSLRGELALGFNPLERALRRIRQ